MNNKAWVGLFLLLDWLMSLIAWSLFFFFRKTWLENKPFEIDQNFVVGIIIVPLLWLFIYYLQGSYHEIRRIYRLKISNLTFFGTVIGSVFIFFVLILDDKVTNYQMYYWSFGLLFSLEFVLAISCRLILATVLIKSLRKVGSHP